jgi:hypothetical protein
MSSTTICKPSTDPGVIFVRPVPIVASTSALKPTFSV